MAYPWLKYVLPFALSIKRLIMFTETIIIAKEVDFTFYARALITSNRKWGRILTGYRVKWAQEMLAQPTSGSAIFDLVSTGEVALGTCDALMLIEGGHFIHPTRQTNWPPQCIIPTWYLASIIANAFQTCKIIILKIYQSWIILTLKISEKDIL